jgi:hypothetical protein
MLPVEPVFLQTAQHSTALATRAHAHQAGEGRQARGVAAHGQHQGAALQGVHDVGHLAGHRRQLGLGLGGRSGALGRIGRADGQGLVSGGQQHAGVLNHHGLGVHEAVLAQQHDGGINDQVAGLGFGGDEWSSVRSCMDLGS